ncbi:MAG TPA: hypothetical protein VLX28_00940 [Thermoanaerobaculia bacterium]|nr:hypothetical protein [Thermoanaerobaculia bacterium]
MGLPNAAVSQEDYLHLVLGLGFKIQFGKVTAYPWEAVVVAFVRQDFSRYADRFVGDKLSQTRVGCKDLKELARDCRPTAIKIECLKAWETGQRRKVRHTRAQQVEALKAWQTGQRRKVREFRGFPIEVPFKISCFGELLGSEIERLETKQISQAGRKLLKCQIAEIQGLGLESPSLLDPPLRLQQVWLHGPGHTMESTIFPNAPPRSSAW